MTGVKDARAKLTQYLYDDAGRLTVTVDAGDGRTTQIYDDDGRVSAVRNANNYLTTYLYDSLNRATVTIDAENNRVTALYDVAGRQTGLIDGRGNLTQYQLDAVGRTTVVIDANSKRTTTLYDANGNVTSVKDANNNVTEFLYDALNRKTVTLDPRGTYRTTMLYDAASNLTSIRDAQNNVTTFAYDSLNRKTRETDPLGEAATFAYNAVGLLTSTTDRLARWRDFQYDAANRLTTETWFTAGTAVETILYSYDAVGNRLTAQNGVGTYTMTYDALNRATVVNGLWGVTLTMAYDAVGNRTRVEDSFGGVATSTYDKANRLTQRKLDAGTPEIRADQTYNGAHQIETQTRWSDLSGSTKVGSTTYTYDAVNRVTAIDHRNGSGTLLATYLYSYKDNGELLTQKINGGATTTYGYDAASQLTADGATNYSYDGTGNRTNGSYATGTGNRLETDGTWDYSYDDEGNVTQKSLGQNAETWEYGYDHRNQMTSAKQYSAAAGSPRELWSWTTYRYDANGNRVEKVIESVEVDEGFSSFVPLPGVERYALDGWKTGPQKAFVGLENWDVWADLDSSNAEQVRYLRGDVIDQLFARVASGSSKWELVDRLGSVLAETDDAGAVESTISYDGFGNAVSGSLPGRYQWTGREKDVETGLQYNRARYYDPATARWTSTDPLGFDAGDSNLYRYASNRPTGLLDPQGLAPIRQDGALSIKSIKVYDKGDSLGGLPLGPILGENKFAWGFKVVIEGQPGQDITKAKILKMDTFILVRRVENDVPPVFAIYDGRLAGKAKYKDLSGEEFLNAHKQYGNGKGEVAYKPDIDKDRILNKKLPFSKVEGNKVTFVDGPGWPAIAAGQELSALTHKMVELHMKFKVTAVGTDGKQVVAEFFRYQIGTSVDGKWIIKEGKFWSGNTTFPLEKMSEKMP